MVAVDRAGVACYDAGELVRHYDHGAGDCGYASGGEVRVCEFCKCDWMVAEWNRYVSFL